MSVSPSVCQSVTRVQPAKTAKRIDVLFRVETFGDPRNIVIRCGSRYPRVRGSWGNVDRCRPTVPVPKYSPDSSTFDAAIAKLL